jgi:membrane protein implicated in regulation of membrane protease activity
MPWWLWMLLGMVLAVLELQAPGSFFLLGFGIGAITVGALASIGLSGPPWLQWLLFSVLSVAAVLLFRRFLLKGEADRWTGAREIDNLVGQEVVLTEDLAVGGASKGELRGTTWSVRNAGDAALSKGQRCRVERVEGLTLWLRGE